MEVTIKIPRERNDFSDPTRLKKVIDVPYVTDLGYHGSVTLDSAGFTKEKALAAAAADALQKHSLIGSTFKA